MSMRLRRLSFLRHRIHSLCSVPTLFRSLRTEAPSGTDHAPSRHRHVSQHRPDERLSCHINHYILSNCANPPHPRDCSP